jgi:hypothetical protein
MDPLAIEQQLEQHIVDLVEDWALYADADIETLCERIQIAWDGLQRQSFEPDDEPFEPMQDGDYPF